jgi:AcrR family transcriptional regulator
MNHPSGLEFAFMNTPSKSLKPRKTPIQARSAATVAALHTATIQVLTQEGLARCNTTRVAERAGMSVGSVYQYYPNRDALLATVLAHHLERVAEAVEEVCAACTGQPVEVMAARLVKAFLAAKLHDAEESKALYRVAAERDGAHVVARVSRRMSAAVSSMLASAPDVQFKDPTVTAAIALGALGGPVRALLEGLSPPEFDQHLPEQLTLLLQGYFRYGGRSSA